MEKKKGDVMPQVMIVSGLRDAGAMGELIDTMTRMDISPKDLIRHLKEMGEPEDDTVTFVGLDKPMREVPGKPAVHVRLTTGYFRRLHKFINVHCENNRSVLINGFVQWMKGQPVDQLIKRMARYMNSPVRTHRTAKKDSMYINTSKETYTYLYDFAFMLAEKFDRKVSASDVVRGLVFNYINSVSC